ncbi:MAG: diaminopimelate epimerase [Firmicutes bacterium]|nr:diaminopimelate epimerase [Bacillota bacterium]
MAFIKMEGAGNDYVYVDGVGRPLPDLDWPEVARRVSDRRFGVGSDGLILIARGERAPFRMIMFNADGSRGEMCGNGMRCLAFYVHAAGYTAAPEFEVETDGGPVRVAILESGRRRGRVRVDMGPPRLEPERIPTTLPGTPVVGAPLEVDGRTVRVAAVSMGNPHCVVFLDENHFGAPLDGLDLEAIGPLFEHHPAFPQRVNTEFVEVEGPDRLRMRVWERGSGETWACGTGACAALVAAALTGRSGRRARVGVRGGELEVEWAAGGHVFLSGPAVEVFRGTFPVEEERV